MKNIPTTQTLINNNITTFETNLSQTVPLNQKAFLRVLSVVLGINSTDLYKFGIHRVAQNLALTADDTDLDNIGKNYGVYRKSGIRNESQIIATGTPGTVIPTGAAVVGDSNNYRYFPTSDETLITSSITIDVQAEFAGDEGNLLAGDSLTWESNITGLDNVATLSSTVTEGVDVESDDAYRIRVLDEIRTVGGGSNGVDYRTWAQRAIGVWRAFPYAGKPFESILDSVPGDRTVYIEGDPDINNGIPTSTVLDAAEAAIKTTDGVDNQCLGSTDTFLYVEPVRITQIYFEVRGMVVNPASQAAAEALIETELDTYLKNKSPYVDGTDVEIDKNDIVISTEAGQVVNVALGKYGGYSTSTGIGLVPGSFLGTYELNPGELTISGGVTYG